MTLSKKQLLAQSSKPTSMTHFALWERDLLECARRWPAWKEKANELGYTDEKIFSFWPHVDSGKLVFYMPIPPREPVKIPLYKRIWRFLVS